jgi:lipoprotein-releasing system ATP-binding protein
MLSVKNIFKSYGDLNILNDISLNVNEGEIISIVGSSGAGKTTLLQIMGTLDTPDNGSLEIGGIDPFKLNSKKLADFRNKSIGFIFQSHQLLPEFSAIENIILPALIGGYSKPDSFKEAQRLMEIVGIDNRAKHKPSELSGGEQQRVAVCRALINNPKIVFADEPSGNLDSKNAKELHELFFMLRKDLKQTFVIVTHNESLANMADNKITISDGKISL